MNIAIQKISIKDLGPIKKFTAELRKLNVIYGLNEMGKTFIVEFIIRSLFQKHKEVNLRELTGNGRITLSGIESQFTQFSPSSPKLEEFFEQKEGGLPSDFSRLLVIKGADSTLTSHAGGVDKKTVKRYLSNLSLLDRMDDNRNISDTIKNTTLENNIINGPKRGELKKREELINQLKYIDTLFDQLARGYGGGQRKTLEIEKTKLNRENDRLIQARCYQAYCLSTGIQQLESDISGLNEQVLESIKENILTHRIQQDQMHQMQKDLKNTVLKTKYFLWLEKAIDLYRKRLDRLPDKPPIFLILIPILISIAAGFFIFLKWLWPSMITLILAMGATGLYLFLLNRYVNHQNNREELKLLQSQFEENFNQSLNGLVQMEALYQDMQKDNNQVQFLQQKTDQAKLALNQIEQQIDHGWMKLVGHMVPEKDWNVFLKSQYDQLREVKQKLHQKEKELAGLVVSPSDYTMEDPGITYNQTRFNAIQSRLQRIEGEIKDAYSKLDQLKHLICKETGDSPDQSWDTLIEHFQKQRSEVLTEYQDITSEILGKLAVHRVIERVRSIEDKKINEGLNSSHISDPLKKITNRYHRLRLQDEDIFVLDEFHEFKLSDLSTGAQEQVLLALRLGFASSLLGKERHFIILDDAFQHSDWKKRPKMIDVLIELSKDNWQILYFTMDDNIRNLFIEKGKSLGKDFVMINLS